MLLVRADTEHQEMSTAVRVDILVGTSGEHTRYLSGHISEYHYRKKNFILTLNLLDKWHHGFSAHRNEHLTILRCPCKLIPV